MTLSTDSLSMFVPLITGQMVGLGPPKTAFQRKEKYMASAFRKDGVHGLFDISDALASNIIYEHGALSHLDPIIRS